MNAYRSFHLACLALASFALSGLARADSPPFAGPPKTGGDSAADAAAQGSFEAAKLPARRLQIVAHQDDDLLFLMPDLAHAIGRGESVTTVYVTAGSRVRDDRPTAYHLAREAGAMAAYAKLLNAPNLWDRIEAPVVTMRLNGHPYVTLIFLRVPVSASEAGGISLDQTANLALLWNSTATGQTEPLVTTVDGLRTYTRASLIATLADVMRGFAPDIVATLDSSGLFGSGQDPSGVRIRYSASKGLCYFYDHSDHYYSALFARSAEAVAALPHRTIRYRAYNAATEVPNVDSGDAATKSEVFAAYARHDPFVPDQAPFGDLYDAWIARQYSGAPSDQQDLCLPPGGGVRAP